MRAASLPKLTHSVGESLKHCFSFSLSTCCIPALAPSLNEPNDGRPSGPQDTKIMKQSYFPSENDDHVFEDLEIGSCSITPVYNGSHDTFCVSVQTNAPYTSYRQPSNEF